MTMGTPLAEVHARHAENVLLAPSPGLMIWTAITFGLCLLILTKYVFPPVNAMIDPVGVPSPASSEFLW